MSDGTGRIFKRGNVWWIDYGFRGERHRESSGSTKKKAAKKLLRKRMEEMNHGGPRVDEDKVTFDDLATMIETDYVVNERASLPRLKSALKHLRATFGGWRAVDITTDKVKAHVRTRLADGAAKATVQREVATLSRAFTLAVEADRLSQSPHIPNLKINNTRTGFLTAGDVDAVCREISDDLAPVVRFAFLTGWRKGEIIEGRPDDDPGLRWRQVDWEAGTVRLDPGTTKNDDGRTFPFGVLPPLEDLLRRQRRRTDAVERRTGRIVPHVFHRDGDPIKSMRGAWKGACKRAGLEGALFHDLRRSAVRNLEAAGVPRSVAMKLTGHKTESVYRRYAIADETALRDGVEKLAAHHAGDDGGGRTAIPIQQATGGGR